MVASIQLRLAVETEVERRSRPENDAATKRLRLAMEMDEERKARLGNWWLPHSSGWPWRQRKKEEQKKKELIRFGFDLNLIWIEIGVFKNKMFQGMSPLAL